MRIEQKKNVNFQILNFSLCHSRSTDRKIDVIHQFTNMFWLPAAVSACELENVSLELHTSFLVSYLFEC